MSKDKRIDLTNIKITSDLNREDAQTHTECWAEGTLGNGGPLMDYLIAELKKCYEELDRPKVTIDDWDKAGPCVTVYLEGKEYVGILREYNASE